MICLASCLSIDGKHYDREFESCLVDHIEGMDFLNIVFGGEGTPGYPAAYLNECGRIDSVEHFYAFYKELLGELYLHMTILAD